jgi:peroxiredoxin
VTAQKSPRYRRWARDILILLAVFLAIQWWQARDMPRGEAPALLGLDLEGQPLALSAYRGQPVLVHFWATWCPVCRLGNDSIARIAEDHAVISVATTSGTAAELRAFLEENGLRMPVLLDESGELARQWKVRGVPATFVVDSAGLIDYAGMGYSSEIGLRVRLALAD